MTSAPRCDDTTAAIDEAAQLARRDAEKAGVYWNADLIVLAHEDHTEIRFPGEPEPLVLRPGEQWKGTMHADLRGERARTVKATAQIIRRAQEGSK